LRDSTFNIVKEKKKTTSEVKLPEAGYFCQDLMVGKPVLRVSASCRGIQGLEPTWPENALFVEVAAIPSGGLLAPGVRKVRSAEDLLARQYGRG
jgi:hypothetical protein